MPVYLCNVTGVRIATVWATAVFRTMQADVFGHPVKVAFLLFVESSSARTRVHIFSNLGTSARKQDGGRHGDRYRQTQNQKLSHCAAPRSEYHPDQKFPRCHHPPNRPRKIPIRERQPLPVASHKSANRHHPKE